MFRKITVQNVQHLFRSKCREEIVKQLTIFGLDPVYKNAVGFASERQLQDLPGII